MEDNRENQRPRPYIFKSQSSRPSTFDVCEYQICIKILEADGIILVADKPGKM
jgi:hypothetical protein